MLKTCCESLASCSSSPYCMCATDGPLDNAHLDRALQEFKLAAFDLRFLLGYMFKWVYLQNVFSVHSGRARGDGSR